MLIPSKKLSDYGGYEFKLGKCPIRLGHIIRFRRGHIEGFGIEEDFRGLGLGTLMMQDLIKKASKMGLDRITLHVYE